MPSYEGNNINASIENAIPDSTDLNCEKAAAYINKVWDIRTSAASDESALVFMARCFIQATLPHSDPGIHRGIWLRKNGQYKLEIKSARALDEKSNAEVNIGLPYGSVPRLLLIWMTSEALRTKEPRLLLGSSIADFMSKIGLESVTGGKNGSLTRVKAQAYKLFRSEFTMTQQLQDSLHEKDLKISSERMLFWNHKTPEQNSLWNSWVTLTPEFFETITHNPAPLDLRALQALRSSSMDLDLYMWLSHRTFYLDKPQHLSWKALEGQLGANYGELKKLRFRVRKAVNKIKVFWPELNADFDNPETITLYPSRSLISVKEMRQGKLLLSR